MTDKMDVNRSDGLKQELLGLLKSHAYKKGDYTLSSGRKSEHYVNCKPVTLSSRGLTLSSVMLLEAVEKESVAVAGLTLGADPLVSGVAVVCGLDNIRVNALIVRKEAKGHGTQAYIEGPLPEKGATITVLEDVITTGGSAIQAVKRLRDAGYTVNRVAAIVDRQEDGEADTAMKLAGLELVSIFKLEDITGETN
jgi:orotate phosphoribosyltransferase